MYLQNLCSTCCYGRRRGSERDHESSAVAGRGRSPRPPNRREQNHATLATCRVQAAGRGPCGVSV